MTTDSPPQSEFLKKATEALGELFRRAQGKDELNFAISLAPEFRAYTRTSAIDAHAAFDEYVNFLQLEEFVKQNIRTRVMLQFYCHVAEAEGFWGVPMCLLGVLEGQQYNLRPFGHTVRDHKITGQSVAPNANVVMQTLAGCADSLGLKALAGVFRDAFDADIRNDFAHADYALSSDGLRVRGRHDKARLIGWPEFDARFRDGIGLYETLQAPRVVRDAEDRPRDLPSRQPRWILEAPLRCEGGNHVDQRRCWVDAGEPRRGLTRLDLRSVTKLCLGFARTTKADCEVGLSA